MRRKTDTEHLLGMTLTRNDGPEEDVAQFSSPADDHSLAERIHRGDREAFSTLYHQYVHAVYGYASSVVQSRDDLDDVVQETFVTAWQRLDGAAILDRSALPWLLTTARFKAYNLNRTRAKRTRNESPRSSQDHNLYVVGADENVITADVRQALDTALSQLSDIDRIVYEICLIDGSTYAQAAEALDITSGAVRNRLARVRQRLQTELLILKGQN